MLLYWKVIFSATRILTQNICRSIARIISISLLLSLRILSGLCIIYRCAYEWLASIKQSEVMHESTLPASLRIHFGMFRCSFTHPWSRSPRRRSQHNRRTRSCVLQPRCSHTSSPDVQIFQNIRIFYVKWSIKVVISSTCKLFSLNKRHTMSLSIG